jgi:hypothetical protein
MQGSPAEVFSMLRRNEAGCSLGHPHSMDLGSAVKVNDLKFRNLPSEDHMVRRRFTSI